MTTKRLTDHRGRSVPVYSATDAKNAFGAVLEDAARYGAVGISKHDKPRFVVLAIEEYASMQPPTLNALEAEFDRRVAAMQTPQANAAYRRLLDATPEALNRVRRVDPPVQQATKSAAKHPAKSRKRRA